jgi:hypothetical protein
MVDPLPHPKKGCIPTAWGSNSVTLRRGAAGSLGPRQFTGTSKSPQARTAARAAALPPRTGGQVGASAAQAGALGAAGRPRRADAALGVERPVGAAARAKLHRPPRAGLTGARARGPGPHVAVGCKLPARVLAADFAPELAPGLAVLSGAVEARGVAWPAGLAPGGEEASGMAGAWGSGECSVGRMRGRRAKARPGAPSAAPAAPQGGGPHQCRRPRQVGWVRRNDTTAWNSSLGRPVA